MQIYWWTWSENDHVISFAVWRTRFKRRL